MAFITTVHERRMDVHSERLSRNADFSSPLFHGRIDALTKTFERLGFSHFDSVQHAQGMLYNGLTATGRPGHEHQSLGFMDCFRTMAVVAMIGIPLALMTKGFRAGGEASGGH